MNKKELIKELAKKALKDKWGFHIIDIYADCPFCNQCEHCEDCLLPPILCGEPEDGYVLFDIMGDTGHIVLSTQPKPALMIEGIKMLAETGELTKEFEKRVKKVIENE